MPTSSAIDHSSEVGDLAENLSSFRRHLRAENKTPATIVTYAKAVEQFAAYLAAAGMPTNVAAVRREHVEAFLVSLQEKGQRPATVAQRYRSLQQFFKWLVGEGEIRESPMTNMRPPRVPVEPPPIIRAEQFKALLETCKGTEFEDRRDTALLYLFYDTGMRRGEAAGIELADLDRENDQVVVMGKGRRPRACPYAKKTAVVIDRYLRARALRADASLPWFWLGKRGRLTETGIEQAIKRRGAQAGMPEIHPHLFRHTYAHNMLVDGMQEGDLMRLAGWQSRQMLSRYGASAADERARAAYRNHGPSDRL